MNYKEITELVKLVSKSNLSELKVKNGDFEIAIRTQAYSKEKASTGKKAEIPQIVSVTPQAPPVQPAPSQAPAPAPASEADLQVQTEQTGDEKSKYLEIRSPMVGTFYRSSAPEKPPYVKVGDSIEAGSVVCIIEAMKLFNEIESEISGKIAKVLVEDAAPVEYDQVLFLVEP